MNRIIKRVLALILFVAFAFNGIAGENPKSIIKGIKQAFKEKNTDLFKTRLSKSFAIGIFSSPQFTDNMLAGIFNNHLVDQLELVKVKRDKNGSKLIVKCSYPNEQLFESTIYLDAEGKIERVGFFDKLYGVDLSQESKLVAELPFVLDRNRIVIKVKVNNSDRELRIMFDTGADGMGMKKAVADEIGLKVARQQQTNVVGGGYEINISSGNELKFGSTSIPNQNIGLFPSFMDDLDGLLGGNLLRKFITEIDFDRSVIKLSSFGSYQYPENGAIIPLDYSLGIPSITADLELNNGKKFESKLHFDTGAGYPVILYGPSVKQLELLKDFKVLYKGINNSMGHRTPSVQGVFNHLKLGDKQINNFQGTIQEFRDGDEKWSREGDGSLGIEIIKQFNCIINVAAGQYYLTPNKNFKN
ncbi:retropepsin-like aspartic protease [Solitalea longa]|uniref:retropepsin-like aspartic protease n=1 Tax=Solitalea longa TaxID=2079460 RepID=UPI0013FDCDAC|nr:retropepsin-like aspartic protease [Solitalea longa]